MIDLINNMVYSLGSFVNFDIFLERLVKMYQSAQLWNTWYTHSGTPWAAGASRLWNCRRRRRKGSLLVTLCLWSTCAPQPLVMLYLWSTMEHLCTAALGHIVLVELYGALIVEHKSNHISILLMWIVEHFWCTHGALLLNIVEHLCSKLLHKILPGYCLDITWIFPGTLINVAQGIVLCCSIFKFSGTLFGGQGRCGYVVIQLGTRTLFAGLTISNLFHTTNDHQQRRNEYQELYRRYVMDRLT